MKNNFENSMSRKFIAIILIMALTFSDFAIVGSNLIVWAADEETYDVPEGIELEVSQEVTKYMPYIYEETSNQQEGVTSTKSGVLLQVKLNQNLKYETEETEKLPIEQNNITIEVPTYNGIKPEGIFVTSTKTEMTNGKKQDNVEFTQSNDETAGTITITVTNQDKVLSTRRR